MANAKQKRQVIKQISRNTINNARAVQYVKDYNDAKRSNWKEWLTVAQFAKTFELEIDEAVDFIESRDELSLIVGMKTVQGNLSFDNHANYIIEYIDEGVLFDE